MLVHHDRGSCNRSMAGPPVMSSTSLMRVGSVAVASFVKRKVKNARR